MAECLDPDRIADRSGQGQRTPVDWLALREALSGWAAELGFQGVGVSGLDLGVDERRLLEWLAAGRHGDMHYMARHGTLRARPAQLLPGTLRIVSVRMDYLPADAAEPWSVLDDAALGYVSRYALGRDYHKSMRRRLQRLAERIETEVGPFGYRAFVDSAPVLEKPIAAMAGLGWVGKHSNVLSREAGSWFFLGELFTDLPLPPDAPVRAHCGQCTACIDVCPTDAIVAPYQVDARLCISYLTIEHPGAIPESLRTALGNRIYGCDDCQLVCPWNRFAQPSAQAEHDVRNGLDAAPLTELFAWSEAQFEQRLQGSAIRRIGHRRWLRNIAVALGNAPSSAQVVAALRSRLEYPDDLIREHVAWALARHGGH